MRRWLVIAGAAIGLVLLVLGYAFFNLNAIIEANRDSILARASAALGRPVEVGDITTHLGWGAAIDLRDVKIADDPVFAQLPFLEAHDVYVEVSLLPLLMKSLEVTRIQILQPVVRVIRDRAGHFNVGTLGVRGTGHGAARAGPASITGNRAGGPGAEVQLSGAPPHRVAIAALKIASLHIDDGAVFYQDEQAGGSPIKLNGFDLTVSDFRADSSFRIEAALAALSDQPNLKLAGEVGPLIHNSVLVLDRVPLDLTAAVGPLSLDQLRTVPALGRLLPAELTVSTPVMIDAKISGAAGTFQLDARSDLTSSHIVYGSLIDKAAGVPLQLSVDAVRDANRIALTEAVLAVAGLSLTATNITYGADKVAARLDTGRADLTNLAEVLPFARDYHLRGGATIHAFVALTDRKPSATGSLVLDKVSAIAPDGKMPPLNDVRGTVQMTGDTAKVGPLSGNVGSTHATAEADVGSFAPLRTTYQVALDTLKPGEFMPSRQPLGEQMSQVVASGELTDDAGNLTATTKLASAAGTLANVAYRNLALNAAYDGNHLNIDSLKLAAFDGTLAASGSALVGTTPSFDLELSAKDIDLHEALEGQKGKAAETLHGRLTGALQVFGAGAKFDQIRPTLRGAGRATLVQGKLVGVNVVAEALNKVDNLPGIGALVPAAVVNRHPELFKSHDTAIDQASLTFTLLGPRLTSHDIDARTADYTILGDGWFDMDKQIDLAARILLSPAFSGELASARHAVAYLENPARQIEIPLRIAGRLPKPRVVPDVAILIRRATTNALENGLGRLLGGSSNRAKNPLDELKGLFR
jgi:uncharacterized protein involved in outer membrane biogenesis